MNETTRICQKCGAPVPSESPQGLCPKCVLAAAAGAPPPSGGSGAPEPPPLDQVAAAFPNLEILELIGAGGMGAVFKARQSSLDRLVALKVLPESLAADPAFAERFSREARTLARLNHPNIVAVHDFGHSGRFYFLTMEYVDGVNLREAMAAGRFTPQQALGLVPRICEALQFAHDEGILHRDIKPENILLDVKGRVKIADFGIAKLIGPRKDITLTASGAAVGTPHYMAPEQLERPQEVDQRADIYSLGVVFYEMLTGELPLGRFALPSEKSSVDPRVDPIVLRALERDRDKRFRTASEVKTRVESLGASMPPPPLPPLDTAQAAAGGTVSAAAPAEVKWSRKAIVAAVLSALGGLLGLVCLLLAIFISVTVAHGRGGVGAGEVLILLAIPALAAGMALAGLILGIMARREIRDSQGRLRGVGLALFAIWFPLVLLLAGAALFVLSVGWFTIASPVSTPRVERDPGLLLRQTYKRTEGGRLTESRWALSAAPGRAVKVSIGVFSNGVSVLEKPLAASFVTPEPGNRVDGEFSFKLLTQPGEGQIPWQARLDASPLVSTTLEPDDQISRKVEWQSIRDFPKISVATRGGSLMTLLDGVQTLGPEASGRTARWEARLELAVSDPPPLVEVLPAPRPTPPPQPESP